MADARLPKGPMNPLVQRNIRFRASVAETLDKVSEEDRMSKREVVEQALLEYFARRGKRRDGTAVTHLDNSYKNGKAIFAIELRKP